jgi:hypothetical protein
LSKVADEIWKNENLPEFEKVIQAEMKKLFDKD